MEFGYGVFFWGIVMLFGCVLVLIEGGDDCIVLKMFLIYESFGCDMLFVYWVFGV